VNAFELTRDPEWPTLDEDSEFPNCEHGDFEVIGHEDDSIRDD